MKIKLSQFTPRNPEEVLITPGKSFHKDNSRKYLSRIRCYKCDEKGNYARECPRNKNVSHKKKGNKRIHHAHAAENDEPSKKKTRYESEISSSDEEYVLIFALTGNITHARMIGL